MFENLPDIPPSDYGYWVAPDGTFHAVEAWEKHVGVAGRVLGRPPGGEGPLNDDHRIDLLEQGWTRVAMHSGRFVIQLPPVPVQERVIERLHRLVVTVHRHAPLPIKIEDGLTGHAAGADTVRPGDARVLRAWRKLAKARGVRVARVADMERKPDAGV